MLITDIKRVIEQVGREKGINTAVLIAALKDAVEAAAKKKLGARVDIEVHYDDKTGEVEVFQFKEVVGSVDDSAVELTIEDGLKYDAECELGDSLGIKVDTSIFGRIAAQAAKQVIIQRMKAAERNAVYENFIHKKGEIINGIVQRIDRGNILVNLGQAEAVLSSREQVSKDYYRRGDRIRAYILDVLEEARGAQVVLSRIHSEFVVKLFASEVPEISEGIVSVKGVAREPGVRSKIAVSSTDSDVDPVGACVGMKGNRVQSIVQELRGEKIDIVSWSPDVAKFVCNALAPAEVTRVIIDEDNKSMEVIVADDFLSIAIGKNGQNVRLACRLTGWHIEVMSEKEYSSQLKHGYDSLMTILDVSFARAEALYRNGFCSARDVSEALVEDLSAAVEISEADAEKLIKNAHKVLANKNGATQEPPAEPSADIETEIDAETESATTAEDGTETDAEIESATAAEDGAETDAAIEAETEVEIDASLTDADTGAGIDADTYEPEADTSRKDSGQENTSPGESEV